MSGEHTAEIARHEQDGRVLSGGSDVDQLAETMERHAPPEPTDKPRDPGAKEAVPGAAAPDAAPAAPVSRGRQRFSDLTAERDAAKAEAAAEKAERARLAAEIENLRRPAPAAAEPPPAKTEPVKAEPTRPEPSEDEVGTKYPTYAAFARDLAEWVIEQREAAQPQMMEQRIREMLDQERAVQALISTAKQSQDRARKAYPDFDALLQSPAGKVPMGRTEDEARARARFIIEHPQSEHIQYAILKDLGLAQKLQASDPYTFGVLVAGLVPAEKPARPAFTPPPAPHPTVGASTPTVGASSADLAKKGHDFDASGYREKRAAERQAARGRR